MDDLKSLQHLVLIQKYKQNSAVDASDAAKLKTRVEEGSAVLATEEEEEEENDAYIEKDGLKFANFQATDVVKMLKELPTSWTVVQISVNSAVDPALSRFNLILFFRINRWFCQVSRNQEGLRSTWEPCLSCGNIFPRLVAS